MKRLLLAAFAASLWIAPASAALKVGATAPDFTAPATLGGKEFTFALADALKHGPVVLYFYPAAFTKGCTIEAHEFADAMPQFEALGVTVIGVSHDNIETLNKFSTTECRSKFPVAADADEHIMKSYDAVLVGASRICQPHVLCDHAGQSHHRRVHRSRSHAACRQDDGRDHELEGGGQVEGVPRPFTARWIPHPFTGEDAKSCA